MSSTIIHISETHSTNSYLKQLLQNQILPEGTTVITDNQTDGRGQRGNSWESEIGKNLTFSIVLYPTFIPIQEQFILSQIVSLAIKDILDQFITDITIKWPNDIYWKNKKICGILIENSLSDNIIQDAIIGIGLNINQEEFLSNAPNPISLKQSTQREHNLKDILLSIHKQILSYYEDLRVGKKQSIIDKYKNHLFRKEGYHLYNDGETNFEAKIKNVLPTGHLTLKTKEGIERIFAFKEIKFILD